MPDPPSVRIYTDGGARRNPGPGAYGVVVADDHDSILAEDREYLGETTNNRAEYRAVIRGLKLARRYTSGDVLVTTDSELLVRQLNGRYRVKDEDILPLFREVEQLCRSFHAVRFAHRPRRTGLLARADDLVNEELDARGFPKSR